MKTWNVRSLKISKTEFQNATITANNDQPPDHGLRALTRKFVVALVAIPWGRRYTDPFHGWGTWGLRRNRVNSPVNTAHQQWTGAQIQIWIHSLPLGSMFSGPMITVPTFYKHKWNSGFGKTVGMSMWWSCTSHTLNGPHTYERPGAPEQMWTCMPTLQGWGKWSCCVFC